MTLNIYSIELVAEPPHITRGTVGVPLGTKLLRIDRVIDGCKWWLWTATRNHRYGTYIVLHDNGAVTNVTARRGEGDEAFEVRPADIIRTPML